MLLSPMFQSTCLLSSQKHPSCTKYTLEKSKGEEKIKGVIREHDEKIEQEIEQKGKRLREEINRNNLILKRINLGELILITVISESMNACGKFWKLKV